MNEIKKKFLLSCFEQQGWPALQTYQVYDKKLVFNLVIDAELIWFGGHFPDRPVTPGVVQVHWAAKLAQLFFPQSLVMEKIVNLKFKTMMLPETEVVLTLMLNELKQSVAFSYKNTDTDFSVGTFYFLSS